MTQSSPAVARTWTRMLNSVWSLHSPYRPFVAGGGVVLWPKGGVHLPEVCALFSVHSAEDSESPLDWLPMAPEIEDPEEPGWGQLEVREWWSAGWMVGGALANLPQISRYLLSSLSLPLSSLLSPFSLFPSPFLSISLSPSLSLSLSLSSLSFLSSLSSLSPSVSLSISLPLSLSLLSLLSLSLSPSPFLSSPFSFLLSSLA